MNQRKAGALLSYVYLALTFVVGLFYTPFAISFLGKEEYGVFSIALSAISFLTILDMGFNQTMIRYVSKYKALNDKDGEQRLNGMFLVLYTGIALFALIAGIVLSFFIEDIFVGSTAGLTEWEAVRLKVVFVILLVNLVGSFPLGVYTAILNANEGFVVLKGINILTFFLTYGGMTIALFCGYNTIILAVITTVVSLALKLIQGIYVQKKYKPRFRIRGWDKTLFKEVFAFSFFIFLNIVIDQLYANTDKFILGIVKNSFVVTVYTVGVQFTYYFEQFSTSISGVFLPHITELTTKEKDLKKVSEIFVRIGRIQFIILGFLMSGFIVFGRMFIGLWVGDEMGDAYAIALVVIIPAIVPLSQNIGISVIRALNRHRFRSVMYLGIAVLNVGLSIPLAMRFGGFGAACATGFGTCLGQIITMNWFYYKKIGLDIPGYWKEVLKIVVVLVPVGLVGFGIHLLPFWDVVSDWNGWISFICQGLIYSMIFVACAWLFIFNGYEKGLIRGAIKSFVKILIRLIPMREDVMLESHPDFADSTLMVYNELIRSGYNTSHRIYWCVYDENNKIELPENVFMVYKNKNEKSAKLRLVMARARCKYIIDSNSYIHKLRKGQIRLHLGHGMPIKFLPEYTNYNEIGECDGYLTCGTYWKDIYTSRGHIPEKILLPLGYPRNDILVKGTIDHGSPGKEHGYFWHLPERERFILWMPTYRQHVKDADERNEERQSQKQAIEDGHWEVFAMEQLRLKNAPKMPFGMPEVSDPDELKTLDEKLGECGLKLYFRPHPSQDLRYVSNVALDNVRIADDEFLRRCEETLYEMLSKSEALITDYSSVYFDYLLTGKPIGLTQRDAASFFRNCECCFDDLEGELAGYHIHSFKELIRFVGMVADGSPMAAVEEAKGWFHDVTDGTSTDRVIGWLKEHGMELKPSP